MFSYYKNIPHKIRLVVKYSKANFTVVVMLLSRSDYSQHAVCLPYEDEKGVVVFRSHAPPAGQILLHSSCHSVNRKHLLRGTDSNRNHHVPPLASLSSISLGKSCLFRAAATGGTLILTSIILSYTTCFHNASCLSEEVVDGFVQII